MGLPRVLCGTLLMNPEPAQKSPYTYGRKARTIGEPTEHDNRGPSDEAKEHDSDHDVGHIFKLSQIDLVGIHEPAHLVEQPQSQSVFQDRRHAAHRSEAGFESTQGKSSSAPRRRRPRSACLFVSRGNIAFLCFVRAEQRSSRS